MAAKNRQDSRVPARTTIPAISGLIETLLDRFGWPGVLVIYGLYFLEKNATQDQKRSLIDLYFLGKGINFQYPLIILGGVALLAFLAQWGYYQRRVRLMKAEIKRLGEWKTQHQQEKIGVALHHSTKGDE
jgi:hypothetical protein